MEERTRSFSHHCRMEDSLCMIHISSSEARNAHGSVVKLYGLPREYQSMLLLPGLCRKGASRLSKLKAQGVVQSDVCVRYQKEIKIEEHILYHCDVAKEVWRKFKCVMGYKAAPKPTLEQELQWLVQLNSKVRIQSDGVKLVFSTYIYWLQKSINLKIFQGKYMAPTAMVNEIRREVMMKLIQNSYKMEEGPDRDTMEEHWGVHIEAVRRRSTWFCQVKPPDGFVKLNTDASICNSTRLWGAIIRDSEGVPVKVAHDCSPYKSVDDTELDAVHQGLLQRKEVAISK